MPETESKDNKLWDKKLGKPDACRVFLALHEFLWDSYLKLSLIFNWNAPSDPRCEDFFAGIVLAAIERASLG